MHPPSNVLTRCLPVSTLQARPLVCAASNNKSSSSSSKNKSSGGGYERLQDQVTVLQGPDGSAAGYVVGVSLPNAGAAAVDEVRLRQEPGCDATHRRHVLHHVEHCHCLLVLPLRPPPKHTHKLLLPCLSTHHLHHTSPFTFTPYSL